MNKKQRLLQNLDFSKPWLYLSDYAIFQQISRITLYGTLRSWYKWKECDGHLKHAREKCR
jgi:hypothetical protein